MNRAMFSGVAGLKTHQTKMDVIGNNIANVNTFGFKSQRAVFSDIFYQTIQGASAGTGNRGGTNPSSVGYGSQLASIQTQMSQSSMQSTGYGMDVAITGEGFFQVMDPDGNIYYTKAGIFDYDSAGYLVDVNGNFVLGATTTDGDPDSRKIKLDDIGSVSEAAASGSATVNGRQFTISASNPTAKGNLSISLNSSTKLAGGRDVEATISASGTISVLLNATSKFASLAELNSKINTAITAANGGRQHAAGTFTISASNTGDGTASTVSTVEDIFANTTGGLTGAEICGTNFDYQSGKLVDNTGKNVALFGGALSLSSTGSAFSGEGDATLSTKFVEGTGWEITLVAGSNTYTGTLAIGTTANDLLLKKDGTSDDDCVVVKHSGYSDFTTKALAISNAANSTSLTAPTADLEVDGGLPDDTSAQPAKPSINLGMGSSSFTLTGGTEGGRVTLDELSSISIGADGIVSVTHPEKGTVAAGRICLANFANPAGLELNGTNYYSASANSGEPQLCDPGSEGSGALKSNALEMSNVDLSAEFADMITTQRGFQANSRIITVSDTMLEELINLKR